MGPSQPICPVRICGLEGYNNRRNDVVYSSPSPYMKSRKIVVYFGGDMQDFTVNMQLNRECHKFLQWNLENTARVLRGRFPDSLIVVVRPSRIEHNTFSCYRNFVPSNDFGSPEHIPMYFALQHLREMLRHLVHKLNSSSSSESKSVESNYEIKLIGFSKGCIVLNQFLYEFHYLKALSSPHDQCLLSFLSRISDMYWLDGGHCGTTNTWITSKLLLETFSKLGINVHVHVTPYQIRDDRHHVRREEQIFTETLRQFSAPIERTLHFESQLPNLNMHFEVLNVF